MKITVGYSSCPNDAFIFDAMLHGKIDTEGIVFEPVVEDVEALNQRALNGELDVTKLSFHVFGYVTPNYVLLNSGAALGRGCGPLVISKEIKHCEDVETANLSVAIPGKYTTANLLLSLAFPNLINKQELLFSKIEDAVLDGRVDLGVIIHENRFTYEQRGLHKVIDLGAYWEQETGCPIPLGGIVVKREMDIDMQQRIDRILRRSVEFALGNPESSEAYVKELAQEMDQEVIRQHIDLYVNEFSVDLGEEGRNAVQQLFEKASELNIFTSPKSSIFIPKI